MPSSTQFENRLAGTDPSGLLPVQHADGVRSGAPPEMQLMAAVLRTAINDFRHYATAQRPTGRRLYRAASAWIASSDATWPYSFENICDVFDLDPHELRRTLMRDRALRERAAARSQKRTVVLVKQQAATPGATWAMDGASEVA